MKVREFTQKRNVIKRKENWIKLKSTIERMGNLSKKAATLAGMALITSCMATTYPNPKPEEVKEWPGRTAFNTYRVNTKELGWIEMKGYERWSSILGFRDYVLYPLNEDLSLDPSRKTIIYSSCILGHWGWVSRKPKYGPLSDITILEVKKTSHWKEDVLEGEYKKSEIAREFPQKKLPIFSFTYGNNELKLTPFKVEKNKVLFITTGYTLYFNVNYSDLIGSDKESVTYNSNTYLVKVITDGKLNVKRVLVYDVGGVVVADSEVFERKVPIPKIKFSRWEIPQ